MNNFVIRLLIASVLITCLVSTLFGLAGSTLIGTFWGWFWVSLLLQVILFSIANSYLIQRDTETFQQQELEMIDKLAKFNVKLNCSYCQQPNLAPISVDQRNTFKCESCNQVNGISMQFMATSLTTPVESVKLPIENSNSVEFTVS